MTEDARAALLGALLGCLAGMAGVTLFALWLDKERGV